MALREFPGMTATDARLLNPLQLAHLGDTVWELMVRSRVTWARRNVRNMHKDAVACVNAQAQAQALKRIEHMLSEEEADVVRRGKNTHARHAAPKNQDPVDYQYATALEALMGHLYLTGREDRIRELFEASQEVASCPKQD